MIGQRAARMLGVAGSALLLVVGASATAHADGDIVWNHKHGGGCLAAMWDRHFGWSNVGLYLCAFGSAKWHDVSVGGGVWVGRMAEVPDVCLAAYTDHDAYVETCSSGQNDYQRWREIYTNSGWKLQNVATGECLDSNDNQVYMLTCNGGEYQYWT
ncbi:RICIN domain-containing protein [Streptomyces sp. NBC_00727]|uniref:RICIN domain-containing protein n=1 Tax=Streptomyces sp. NBC_00727 TaxID=2903675 RepID=UPI00386FBFDD